MDVNKKKRVAIIGAGPSGLAACKHALAKGFRPVVFEASDAVGGVWTRTLASTRLQTPAAAFRFSDFPWPADVEDDEFPRSDHVAAYMAAYALQFGVLECVRFGSKVLAAEYAGASEREVAAWERWSGNGEAFGDGTGEWHLTVKHGESEEAQVWSTAAELQDSFNVSCILYSLRLAKTVHIAFKICPTKSVLLACIKCSSH
jgi:dimethylaniline monooxygenase (N-oxide forming)